MPPTSIRDLDLTPLPGKIYFTLAREWREEFFYFLLVDRFHDSRNRAPILTESRSVGIAAPSAFYGGSLGGHEFAIYA